MFKYIWLYFKRRPLRILVFILVVALGVAASMILGSIFLSFGETRNRISAVNENWITIQYLSGNGRDSRLDEVIEETLSETFGFYDAIKVDIAYLSYNLFGSARANFPVYGIRQTDIPRLLRESEMQIIQGTVFERDSRDIMVSSSFLKADRLEVGQIYEETLEMSTPGQYSIVSSLKGPSIFGLGPVGISSGGGTYGYMIFAREGFLMAVENELKSALAEYMPSITVNGPASSIDRIREQYTGYYSGIFFVDLVVALVFTVGLTMLNSVSLRERRKEYGVMSAVGYTGGSLKVRLLIESSIQAALGWITGFLAGVWAITVLEKRFFEPAGLFLRNDPVGSLCTLIIPLAVVLLTQFLITGHLKRDLINLLRSASREKGIFRSCFRDLRTGWLRYPVRTGAYAPLFVNVVVFVVLIIFFGSLLSGLSDGIRDGGVFYENRTYVRMAAGAEFPTDIASSPEVKTFNAGLEKLRIKLLFGTSSVYIPVLSPEDARALLLLNEIPSTGTLLVSRGLSERLEDAESLGYSKVEVSTVLKGLSGVMVASPLPGGTLLTYSTAGEAEKIRRSLLSSQTEMILDNSTFEKSYKQETQFMKLITEIIIYLQFFVVMVIGVVTVIRTISARRSEISIRSIIGLKEKETRRMLSTELAAVTLSAAVMGCLAGLIVWWIMKSIFFQGVYTSTLVSTPTVLRVSLMVLSILVAGFLTVRFFASREDPIAIIER
jgi:putative ABC transport system permease protein